MADAEADDDQADSESGLGPRRAVVTVRDWIAAGGIIVALVGAGTSYGRVASALEDAQAEIRLLREDMRAINQHLVIWIESHQREER